MKPGIGISVGGSTAVVAVCSDNRADVVANAAGQRGTPCIVSFHDNEELVGAPAKQRMVRNFRSTIVRPSTFLGRKFSDAATQELCKELKYAPIVESKDGAVGFQIGESKVYECTEIVSHILKEAKATAQTQVQDLPGVVITVPLDATEAWKTDMRRACKLAGLQVSRFISEPAAALMAYDIEQDPESHSHVASLNLVIDVGGSRTTMAVVQSTAGLFEVLDSRSTRDVSGDKYDDVTVSILANEFKKKTRMDVTDEKRSMLKLKTAADTVKKTLSVTETAIASVESLFEGMDLHCSVQRARFEGLSGAITRKFVGMIDELLKSCGITANDITTVLLHGGCSQLLTIRRAVESKFPDRVRTHIPGSDVVAIGAAKEGFAVALRHSHANTREDSLTDACTLEADGLAKAIAVMMGPTQHKVLLPKGTPVPIRATFPLACQPGATSMHVVLGEVDGDAVKEVARFGLKDLDASKEGAAHTKLTIVVTKEGGMLATLADVNNKANVASIVAKKQEAQ